MRPLEQFYKQYDLRQTTLYKPSEQDINFLIASRIEPYKQQIATITQAQQSELRGQLTDFREFLRKQTGVNPSRPILCARVLSETLSKSLNQMALDSHQAGNKSDFVFWFDVAHGITVTASAIILAEEYIRDNADNIITDRIVRFEEYKEKPTAPDVETERYLAMRAEGKEYADLLIEDPSGFLLVDTFVELVKQYKMRIMPHQIPQYVVAGSELAQAAYKATYPWTENL